MNTQVGQVTVQFSAEIDKYKASIQEAKKLLTGFGKAAQEGFGGIDKDTVRAIEAVTRLTAEQRKLAEANAKVAISTNNLAAARASENAEIKKEAAAITTLKAAEEQLSLAKERSIQLETELKKEQEKTKRSLDDVAKAKQRTVQEAINLKTATQQLLREQAKLDGLLEQEIISENQLNAARAKETAELARMEAAADNLKTAKENLKIAEEALAKAKERSTQLETEYKKEQEKTKRSTDDLAIAKERTRQSELRLQQTQEQGRNIMAKAEASAKSYSNSLSSVVKQAFALYYALKTVGTVVSEGFKFNTLMQEQEAAFTVMYKSADKAKSKMQEIFNFSVKSPLTFQESIGAAKQLTAYGFSANTLVDNLKMLGTVAKATGRSLEDISYVYGTLLTQGRAYTRDLTQFAMRGIPIYEELAKVLGVNQSEIQGLVETGKVGFTQMQQVFRNLTAEGGKFGGMIEQYMKTFSGQFSQLKDLFQREMGDLTKPLMNSLTSLMARFPEVMNRLRGPMQAIVRDMNLLLGVLVKTGEVLLRLTPLVRTFIATWAISKITSFVSSLTFLKNGITAVTLALQGMSMGALSAFTALKMAVLGFTGGTAGAAIFALGATIAGITAGLGKIKEYEESKKENYRQDVQGGMFRADKLPEYIFKALGPSGGQINTATKGNIESFVKNLTISLDTLDKVIKYMDKEGISQTVMDLLDTIGKSFTTYGLSQAQVENLKEQERKRIEARNKPALTPQDTPMNSLQNFAMSQMGAASDAVRMYSNSGYVNSEMKYFTDYVSNIESSLRQFLENTGFTMEKKINEARKVQSTFSEILINAARAGLSGADFKTIQGIFAPAEQRASTQVAILEKSVEIEKLKEDWAGEISKIMGKYRDAINKSFFADIDNDFRGWVEAADAYEKDTGDKAGANQYRAIAKKLYDVNMEQKLGVWNSNRKDAAIDFYEKNAELTETLMDDIGAIYERSIFSIDSATDKTEQEKDDLKRIAAAVRNKAMQAELTKAHVQAADDGRQAWKDSVNAQWDLTSARLQSVINAAALTAELFDDIAARETFDLAEVAKDRMLGGDFETLGDFENNEEKLAIRERDIKAAAAAARVELNSSKAREERKAWFDNLIEELDASIQQNIALGNWMEVASLNREKATQELQRDIEIEGVSAGEYLRRVNQIPQQYKYDVTVGQMGEDIRAIDREITGLQDALLKARAMGAGQSVEILKGRVTQREREKAELQLLVGMLAPGVGVETVKASSAFKDAVDALKTKYRSDDAESDIQQANKLLLEAAEMDSAAIQNLISIYTASGDLLSVAYLEFADTMNKIDTEVSTGSTSAEMAKIKKDAALIARNTKVGEVYRNQFKAQIEDGERWTEKLRADAIAQMEGEQSVLNGVLLGLQSRGLVDTVGYVDALFKSSVLGLDIEARKTEMSDQDYANRLKEIINGRGIQKDLLDIGAEIARLESDKTYANKQYIEALKENGANAPDLFAKLSEFISNSDYLISIQELKRGMVAAGVSRKTVEESVEFMRERDKIAAQHAVEALNTSRQNTKGALDVVEQIREFSRSLDYTAFNAEGQYTPDDKFRKTVSDFIADIKQNRFGSDAFVKSALEVLEARAKGMESFIGWYWLNQNDERALQFMPEGEIATILAQLKAEFNSSMLEVEARRYNLSPAVYTEAQYLKEKAAIVAKNSRDVAIAIENELWKGTELSLTMAIQNAEATLDGLDDILTKFELDMATVTHKEKIGELSTDQASTTREGLKTALDAALSNYTKDQIQAFLKFERLKKELTTFSTDYENSFYQSAYAAQTQRQKELSEFLESYGHMFKNEEYRAAFFKQALAAIDSQLEKDKGKLDADLRKSLDEYVQKMQDTFVGLSEEEQALREYYSTIAEINERFKDAVDMTGWEEAGSIAFKTYMSKLKELKDKLSQAADEARKSQDDLLAGLSFKQTDIEGVWNTYADDLRKIGNVFSEDLSLSLTSPKYIEAMEKALAKLQYGLKNVADARQEAEDEFLRSMNPNITVFDSVTQQYTSLKKSLSGYIDRYGKNEYAQKLEGEIEAWYKDAKKKVADKENYNVLMRLAKEGADLTTDVFDNIQLVYLEEIKALEDAALANEFVLENMDQLKNLAKKRRSIAIRDARVSQFNQAIGEGGESEFWKDLKAGISKNRFGAIASMDESVTVEKQQVSILENIYVLLSNAKAWWDYSVQENKKETDIAREVAYTKADTAEIAGLNDPDFVGYVDSALVDMLKPIRDFFYGLIDYYKAGMKDRMAYPRAVVEGSYATGISYVPHDQVAQLHKGEAVMTSEDFYAIQEAMTQLATAQRNTNSSGSSVIGDMMGGFSKSYDVVDMLLTDLAVQQETANAELSRLMVEKSSWNLDEYAAHYKEQYGDTKVGGAVSSDYGLPGFFVESIDKASEAVNELARLETDLLSARTALSDMEKVQYADIQRRAREKAFEDRPSAKAFGESPVSRDMLWKFGGSQGKAQVMDQIISDAIPIVKDMGSTILTRGQNTEVGKMIGKGGTDPFLMAAKSIGDFLMSIENVNKVLNPFQTILEGARTLLEPFINTALSGLVSVLTEVGAILGDILAPFIQLIAINLQMFAGVLKILLIPLSILGKLLLWLSDTVIVPVGNTFIRLMNGLIDGMNFLFGWLGVHIERLAELQTSEQIKNADKLTASIEYLNNKLNGLIDKEITSLQDLYDVGAISAEDYAKRVEELNESRPDDSEDPQLLNGVAQLDTIRDILDWLREHPPVGTSPAPSLFGGVTGGDTGGGDTGGGDREFSEYASGSSYIPQDMLANIHKGEIIVPSTFADSIRNGDMALTGGGQNNKNMVYSIEINVEGSVITERDLAKTVACEMDKLGKRGYLK